MRQEQQEPGLVLYFWSGCLDDMANRRTTIVLTADDASLLREASRREGLTQSELIRKGIRAVTSAYRQRPKKPLGWLRLNANERAEIAREQFGDIDE